MNFPEVNSSMTSEFFQMLHIQKRRLLGYDTENAVRQFRKMVVKGVVCFFLLCSLLIVSLFELFFVQFQLLFCLFIYLIIIYDEFFLPSRQVASTVKEKFRMETKVSEFCIALEFGEKRVTVFSSNS